MFDFDSFGIWGSDFDHKGAVERFVKETLNFYERLLNHIKEAPSNLGKTFDKALEALLSAWKQTSLKSVNLITEIRNLTLEQCEKHGLIGDELKAKLSLVSHYFGELISGEGKSILKKLVGVISVLLDSILEATGVGTAIKETIDTISTLVLD